VKPDLRTILVAVAVCGVLGCAASSGGGAGAAGAGAPGAPGGGGGGTGPSSGGASGGGAGSGAAGAAAGRQGGVEDAGADVPSPPLGDASSGAMHDAVAEAAPEGGGAVDAAVTDVARASGCAGSTLALCEDFESGVLDGKTWKAVQNKGTATIDTSRAARGSKASVHVHVDPGGDTMVGLVETKTFPALQKKLYARAYLYIPGAMATSLFTGDRHSRLIYAQGANPYGEYALGVWNGGLIQNHYSPTDDSQDTKMLPPFDRWFCLEYELDAATGNVRAYLDDAEITALRHDGWPATNVGSLMFGVDRYGTFSVAEDIWFDDLVVDGARIGCAR
jgi:hypothetical protein